MYCFLHTRQKVNFKIKESFLFVIESNSSLLESKIYGDRIIYYKLPDSSEYKYVVSIGYLLIPADGNAIYR